MLACRVQAEQAEKERQLIAALEVMACQMMEAGVIRQDALQGLLCKETELLAASAADDRWVPRGRCVATPCTNPWAAQVLHVLVTCKSQCSALCLHTMDYSCKRSEKNAGAAGGFKIEVASSMMGQCKLTFACK